MRKMYYYLLSFKKPKEKYITECCDFEVDKYEYLLLHEYIIKKRIVNPLKFRYNLIYIKKMYKRKRHRFLALYARVNMLQVGKMLSWGKLYDKILFFKYYKPIKLDKYNGTYSINRIDDIYRMMNNSTEDLMKYFVRNIYFNSDKLFILKNFVRDCARYYKNMSWLYAYNYLLSFKSISYRNVILIDIFASHEKRNFASDNICYLSPKTFGIDMTNFYKMEIDWDNIG